MRIRPIRLALSMQILFPLDNPSLVRSSVQQFPGQLLRQMNRSFFFAGRLQDPLHGEEIGPLLCNRHRHLVLDTTTLDWSQLQQRTTVLYGRPEDFHWICHDSRPLLVVLGQIEALQLRPFNILKGLFQQVTGQLLPAALHDVVSEFAHNRIVKHGTGVIVPRRLNRYVGHLARLTGIVQLLLLVLLEHRLDEMWTVGGHGTLPETPGRNRNPEN